MLQCFANSDCACLHKTVNMVVSFFKYDENIYPKGRALNRGVPQTIKGGQTCD